MNHLKPQRITAMVGLPGSGKSTYAHKLFLLNAAGSVIICPDQIRLELCGDAADQSRNAEVWEKAYLTLKQALNYGIEHIIFDATFVSPKARKDIRNIAYDFDADLTFACVNTPIDECKKRNAARDRKVPEFVIERMNTQLQWPDEREGKFYYV